MKKRQNNRKSKLPAGIREEIISIARKQIRVKELILFGSYAWGKPEKDSDVDIVIILNEEGIPKNYRERMERNLKICNPFYNLRKKVPMDILVYSRDEWEKFISLDGSFTRTILTNGERLI